MILNGKVFNPGELRTRVTLKSRDVTTQTGGFQKPAYTTTLTTVWAKWVNVHGTEAWTVANTLGAMQAATVTIRYRAGIDPTCAVEKDAEIWEIVSIDDIQERHEFLELKVKRVVSG
jgi:SPP1 family predicted phage head-tail adaptor